MLFGFPYQLKFHLPRFDSVLFQRWPLHTVFTVRGRSKIFAADHLILFDFAVAIVAAANVERVFMDPQRQRKVDKIILVDLVYHAAAVVGLFTLHHHGQQAREVFSEVEGIFTTHNLSLSK